MHGYGHWSAQQLAEFLAGVSSFSDEESALRGAVERAAEAVEAEIAVVLRDDDIPVALGFARNRVPEAALRAAVDARSRQLVVPGLGSCAVVVVPLDDGALLLARSGEPFDQDEVALVRGMGRVLGLTIRTLRTVERERWLRRQSEAQATENARLVAGLRERQSLLEHLFRIQRSISHRAPIQQVLDAVTQGAAELLGEDVVGLRLIDGDNPDCTLLASSVGMDDETIESVRRAPLGQGIGSRAIAGACMVLTEDYANAPEAFPMLAKLGMRTAMAAPVHRNGRVVGSLVVGSHTPDRRYTDAEQETLLAFAEHASLALNDASAVDAMRRAYGEAVHQATHDVLTGLPNRALVLDRLTQALARDDRRSERLAVLFVDLDRFKLVNDSLGHSVGDEVLVHVAERLQATVRPGDTVARLAGDEFVVVCEAVKDDSAALRLAERVAEAIAEPIPLYGRQTIITASVGIAIARPGTVAEDLLRDADVAMYRAKERGRARLEVFDRAMRERMLERIETEHELRTALHTGGLAVHYQPTVCLATGRLLSLEALVRWHHPRHGLIGPDDFVPLAEDTGLVIPLGRWVLHEACGQLAAWHRAHPELGSLQVSVNLSARQFAASDLVETVAGALREASLAPDCLWLEITESVLMDEAETTVETLRALRALGVHLSIDDFGTGYSSLSYLKRFPVDVLKIDRSFVDGLGTDPEDEAIVSAVVSLARALKLGVVAEGVESVEQLDELRRLGCDAVQGYYFGRPQPAADALSAFVAPDFVRTIGAFAAESPAPTT